MTAGALTPIDAELACGSSHCITCGDDGEPMRVLAVDADRGLALCSADCGLIRSTVQTALVEPVAVGDELLVHAGTAIAHLGIATP